MFHFKIPQKVININGIKIGGNPGENPPVLIGTIFYHGHRIVVNERKGEFNKEEAEKLIKIVEELSDKTKLPTAIDVVCAEPKAAIKYLDFIASVTKMPILVNTPSIESMKEAFNFIKSSGLSSRVIYNSLTARSKNEEYIILQEAGVKHAIALLYTDRILDVNARLNALESIVKKTGYYGIENILVDTFVIDIPSLSVAMRTIFTVKSHYGYPCGCGAHNAVSVQRKAFKDKFGKNGLHAAELAANLATIVIGADFLLYGPIEASLVIFPAVYTIYTSYRYLLRMKSPLIEIT